MKEKLTTFFSSYKAAVIFLCLYALMMACATFIEKYQGTDVAKALVYYSPLFILLHVLMVINFLFVTISKRLFSARRWGYALTHLSMMVILAGAFTTHLLSFDGILHLREGESSSVILVKNGKSFTEHALPFSVKLKDFILTRYPGSSSPSSYESLLQLDVDGRKYDELVYMNHILDLKGYRFYQASYDPDEQGSILSVSYDVAGRRITYTGYFLLVVGLIGCIIGRGSRFRMLNRKLSAMSAFLLLMSVTASAQQSSVLSIPESHAVRFGMLPMQDRHGRIVPVSTFASEIVRKLHLSETTDGMSDEQILLNIVADPATWSTKPVIIIDNADISARIAGGREIISYRDAFDEKGSYKYGGFMENIYRMVPSARTATDKDMMKLDEKINILHQMFNYQLLRVFPVPGDSVSHRWIAAGDSDVTLSDEARINILSLFNAYRSAVLSSSVSGVWTEADRALEAIEQYQNKNLSGLVIHRDRISAEDTYNHLRLLSVSKRIYFIFGGILLVLSLMAVGRKKILTIVKVMCTTMVIAALVMHALNIALRGYISGHVPWSNAYETMVLLSWLSVFGGLLFARRSFTAFALSVLLGGITLFVSGLNWMDPEITPLVPVLKSPWLMMHVATIMASYGFFGLSCMAATTNLISMAVIGNKNNERITRSISLLTIVNEMSLIVGLALLMTGIFLGAVWANESWGRYWSWDPKETWALITAVVYAAVLHLRWAERKAHHLRFNVLSQLSLLTVLMTYFGVNYLLSGMHSYGNTTGLAGIPLPLIILALLLFIVPGTAAYIRRKVK